MGSIDYPTRTLPAIFRWRRAIFCRAQPSLYHPGQRTLHEVGGPQPMTRHFSLNEFADLSDGRRVTLRDNRGFSSASSVVRFVDETDHVPETSCDRGSCTESSIGISSSDPWRHTTQASLTQSVLAAVQPDDDLYWFEWVVERLRSFGIEIDPASVRAAPYRVEFGSRVLQKLQQ